MASWGGGPHVLVFRGMCGLINWSGALRQQPQGRDPRQTCACLGVSQVVKHLLEQAHGDAEIQNTVKRRKVLCV